MEIWLNVVGLESRYQVSSYGRVRSKKRTIIYSDGRVRECPSVTLKPARNKKTGYFHVVLCTGDKELSEYTHRLVANAFIPNPENLREVNHKDTDKSNNRADNLEWVSSSMNKKKAIESGICYKPPVHFGERCPSSKLTESEVKQIRSLSKQGVSNEELGVVFNVTSANISSIINRKTWKHVN